MTWEKIKRKILGIARCEIEHCFLSRTTKGRLKAAHDKMDEVSAELKKTEEKIDKLMATLDGEEQWFIKLKKRRGRDANI